MSTNKIDLVRAEIERRMRVMKENFATDEASKTKHALTLRLIDHQELLAFIDSMQEEPVSEELEEAARQYGDELDNVLAVCMDDDNSIGEYAQEAFEAGAQWQKEQFEKNRLKHCNSITKEQAKLEQGFIDQHLDKYNRMPTFLDAIEYGMRLQKEQMMKDAVEARFTLLDGFCIDRELYKNYEVGKIYKLIIIKDD